MEPEKLESFIKPVLDNIERISMRDGAIPGIKSGYAELDRLTGGFEGPDLIIIGARPLMGKTTFILNMMTNMAGVYNTPVLFYSLDMSSNQLVTRLLSSISEIDNTHLKCGNLSQEEWMRLMSASAALEDIPLYVSDKTMDLEELCTNAKEMVEKHGIKVIFIDYLQLLSPHESKENRYQDVAYCTRKLKELAKTLNIPIIATSQVNRSPEYKPGRTNVFCKAEMHDLRDSGTICEDANLVILLDRPELTEKDNSLYYDSYDNKGVLYAVVAKNNNGSEGAVKLRFRGECNRIDEWETPTLSGTEKTFAPDEPEQSPLSDPSSTPF